ncbi:MAG TPA: helix-turn-helix domain-containing protein [Acidimicrobiales bacterium]
MTSVTPGRAPRISGAARRDQLLELAEVLFTERGYDAASMDELARRAGVSKPVIYDHFASKEALLAACVDRTGEALAQRVASAAASGSTPQARLRAASLAFFAFVDEQRGIWLELSDPTRGGGSLAEQALRIRRRQAALTVALVAATVADAGLPVDELRIEALAHGLIGSYEALALWWRDHPELTAEQLTDWFLELVWPGLERVLEAARLAANAPPDEQ